MPFLFSLGLMAIAIFTHPVTSDQDLYLHLTMGKLFTQQHNLILTDILSYTALGRPDESHSWLSQLLFWGAYSAGGENGLRFLAILIHAGVLLTLLNFLPSADRQSYKGYGLGLVWVMIHYERMNIRPFLLGELCFVLAVRGMYSRAYWTCAVPVLWANLHGSVVLYPVIALLSGRPWMAFLTFLNPIGYRIYPYAFALSDLGRRIYNLEWMPRNLLAVGKENATTFFLDLSIEPSSLLQGGVIFYLLHQWAQKKVKRVHLLFLMLLFLSFSSMRNRGWLIVTLPFLLLELPKGRGWRVALVSMGIVLVAVYHFPQFRGQIVSIERTTQLMEEVGIEGNLFNEPKWGSYLSFRLYPKVKVAWNFRNHVHRDLYEQVAEHLKRDGTVHLEEILQNISNTELLLLPVSFPKEVVLQWPGNWICGFENNQARLYLQRDSQNWHRLVGYYQKHQIPFSEQQGFDSRKVFIEKRDWFLSYQERPHWGILPSKSVRDSWANWQQQYWASL